MSSQYRQSPARTNLFTHWLHSSEAPLATSNINDTSSNFNGRRNSNGSQTSSPLLLSPNSQPVDLPCPVCRRVWRLHGAPGKLIPRLPVSCLHLVLLDYLHCWQQTLSIRFSQAIATDVDTTDDENSDSISPSISLLEVDLSDAPAASPLPSSPILGADDSEADLDTSFGSERYQSSTNSPLLRTFWTRRFRIASPYHSRPPSLEGKVSLGRSLDSPQPVAVGVLGHPFKFLKNSSTGPSNSVISRGDVTLSSQQPCLSEVLLNHQLDLLNSLTQGSLRHEHEPTYLSACLLRIADIFHQHLKRLDARLDHPDLEWRHFSSGQQVLHRLPSPPPPETDGEINSQPRTSLNGLEVA
ncbi:unnamed protein product [Protopolystoma xenopodis]|uniref:Uncharacterized protein n=1 Tax=Protopolystoma xenopodis TaxID=117903 RepID=A0A448X1T4_9PLAT|nr:unnamed protein product [Protopolystoma xenopodis]